MKKSVFFCAIGGSGMLPLALILKNRGLEVRGSDRSYDQGRTPERFAFLEGQGVKLFPQNGSGVTMDVTRVVVSAAVEKTVPDYKAAIERHIPIITRAGQLAEIFNASRTSIAVAGTSGKSTTTGMLGWILHQAGRRPTIMNGAVMKNFVAPDMPIASAVVGSADLFVSEVDESDGSIDFFNPTIVVLNNIAFDHKSMDELRGLFGRIVERAQQAVINLDNPETERLLETIKSNKVITYGLNRPEASLGASEIEITSAGSSFHVTDTRTGRHAFVRLHVPGRHNISNALAALAGALAAGLDLETACKGIESFTGIKRRLELVGTQNGVTVIDDFAHNPDKIKASLRALHLAQGRLLILFQPHGYGPLRLMRQEFVDCFCRELNDEDLLFMPDPLYLGGTTDKTVSSADLVQDMKMRGHKVFYAEKREACVEALLQKMKAGDTVVVMGARDDTLSDVAAQIVSKA